MFEVENTTHAVPRFRGAHVSQSGGPKGDSHRFQCYNNMSENGICVNRFSNAHTLIYILVLCPKIDMKKES